LLVGVGVDEPLELVDAASGSLLRKMTAEAFACLYWPAWKSFDRRHRSSHATLAYPEYSMQATYLPRILKVPGKDSQLTVFVTAAASVESTPLIVAINNFSLLPRRVDGKTTRCDSVIAGVGAIPEVARFALGSPYAGITIKGSGFDPTKEYRSWTPGGLFLMSEGD
jgi:hypothetical protein